MQSMVDDRFLYDNSNNNKPYYKFIKLYICRRIALCIQLSKFLELKKTKQILQSSD